MENPKSVRQGLKTRAYEMLVENKLVGVANIVELFHDEINDTVSGDSLFYKECKKMPKEGVYVINTSVE